MSVSRPKRKLPASRSGKTMQFEPVPPPVYEALETEAWFRRHLDEPRGRTGKGAAAANSSRAKEALFEEALVWFLAHFERRPPDQFERVQRSWVKTAFWVSDDVLERYRRLAQRTGVDKRQLIATALMLYCQRLVPEELVRFRHKTFTEARTIYHRHRGAIRAALRSKKAR